MNPRPSTSILLQHVQAGQAETARAAGEKAAQRVLHSLHASYADRLETALTEMLVTPAVSLISLDETSTEACPLSEQDGYAYGFSAMNPAAGVLEMSTGLARMVVAQFLRGAGHPQGGSTLSEIELQLLRGILQTLLQGYAGLWARYRVPSLRLEGAFTGFHTHEPLFRATYRVETPLGSGTLSVILRLPVWRPVLAGVPAAQESTGFNPRLSPLFGAIGNCPLPARVLLGTIKVTLKDLLSLAEGDIMCLDTPVGGPLEIRLGNRPKLLGRVHVADERYVITVERSMTGSGA
ncbi:MAG TPA: FliM/FliN family flagellar motor switch protein [Armatimonadota bacterium]|jgi:flagellar motor switch protein FliM